jgi:redox-sensing transcriptional repressor
MNLPPDVVIRRLPLYARSLHYLLDEGINSVSSQELGERINVTAAQIRKDLSYFGEFGRQGIGYNIKKLLHHIDQILGLDRDWPIVLIGVGRLGQAVVGYQGFRSKALQIVAIFDSSPDLIGVSFGGLSVLSDEHIPVVVRDRRAKMAIIAVPAPRAQNVADMLVSAGIRAILNYAPIILQVPDDVWVRDIDPITILHSMTYYLTFEENQTQQKC